MLIFFAIILFVMTESVDLFAGGVACGLSRVRVSFGKVFIINIVGKVILGAALFLGGYIGNIIPHGSAKWICFFILAGLGAGKIVGGLRRHAPTAWRADITALTAVGLGVVLSFDGVAMAIGLGLEAFSVAFAAGLFGVKIVTDQAIFMMSNMIGARVANTKRAVGKHGDFIAGAVIIAVAIVKLGFDIF